jgi:hypothetical protein
VLFEFCDTEIEYLHRVSASLVWLKPNVVGLKIAVDDALFMCLFNGGTHLFENVHGQRIFGDWEKAMMSDGVKRET